MRTGALILCYNEIYLGKSNYIYVHSKIEPYYVYNIISDIFFCLVVEYFL